MKKFGLLHLSDIHIGNGYHNDPLQIGTSILEALDTSDNKTVDCVVVTGDIFDSGNVSFEDNQERALAFLNYIRSNIKNTEQKQLEVSDFILLPGNHDLERNDKEKYEPFKTFLSKFYGIDEFNKNYYDNLSTIKIYEQSRIAIVGLNSCNIEPVELDSKDINFLDDIKDLDEANKEKIINALKKEKEKQWDDYGRIDSTDMREIFIKLGEKVKNTKEYTVIACFHHHFYPFPEIWNRYGDRSLVRNFTEVIQKFQRENIKIVLHGHKHFPLIRPVINEKYFDNPNSMFYVVSGGSVNAKNVDRSFQYINIYAPDQQKLADICRYTYKSEALQVPESFSIPPQETATKTSARLLEILQDVDFEIYREYDENIKEADTISKYFDLDKIIDYLSTVFTCFDSLINELKRNNNVYLILLVLHYRINFLNEKNERINKVTDAKVLLKTKIKNAVLDDDFLNAAIKLLESKNDTDFIDNYKSMEDRFKKHDRYLSYIVITMFFTDLYLILSNYGEVYYRNEKLMHNVNIKLDNDTFHINVPKEFISLTSDIDRRLVIISFKCKNPTVHKIAVLIVKNFERKMNYIEDAFKRLGLKLYYLNPKVEKSSYDLENQNFEAYIPTLIPLLTGKQIYTKDEVFIRELIQNSLDAILLREKILQEENHELPEEERAIKIVFNKEPNEKDGGERGYIQIIDHGIGMDEFKIERYFTSIGRSFYKSDEFAKLKNDKNIKYNPISNFGIGFLSAFMVCKEITVRTKSYEYPDSNGIEIHIPNYDGCFFVKQIDDQRQHIGTIITLYEDSDNKFDIKKYIQYIKQTFLDFQLPIIIDDKFNNDITTIEPYKIRENMDNVLFCPIDDNGNLERISLEEIKNSVFQNYKHGVLLKFDTDTKKQDHIYLNSGIFLSSTFIESMEFNKRYYHPTCYYNFPSKLIELDVSREIIKNFPAPKNDLSNSNIKNFNNKLLIMLSEQATEMLESLTNNPNTKLHDLFHFTTFFEKNLQHSIINFCDYNYKFCLTGNHPGLKLTLVKKNKGDNISNDSVYILFDFYYFSLIDFIRKNASSSNDLINEIAKKAYDPFVSLYKKVVFNVFSILSEDVYRFTDELFDNRRELFDIAQDEFRLFDRGDIRFLLDRFDVPDRIEKLFNRPMHFSIDNQMVKNMNERINKLGKMLRNVEFITDIHSYRGKYKGTKTKDRIAFYAYSVFQSLLHHTNKSSAAILHPLLFFIYIYLDIIKSMDINDANKFTFEIPCL